MLTTTEVLAQMREDRQRKAYERLSDLLRLAGVDIGTADRWGDFYRAARDHLTSRNGDSV